MLSSNYSREFRDIIEGIYNRHGPTLITLASGVYELKKRLMEEGKFHPPVPYNRFKGILCAYTLLQTG